jgi:hypothetical protein
MQLNVKMRMRETNTLTNRSLERFNQPASYWAADARAKVSAKVSGVRLKLV